jgi:hypothetical protein
MAKTIKYYKVNKLPDNEFKRVVGVKRDTFKQMVKTINKYYKEKKRKGGRKRALSVNDELLLMLEYYREYRTFKHLGVDYEVSESSAHYIVTKIEKILIQEPKFHLKSLKHSVPTTNNDNIDVVVVDITESQCERPKKSKDYTIQERKKDIH